MDIVWGSIFRFLYLKTNSNKSFSVRISLKSTGCLQYDEYKAVIYYQL